MDMIANLGFGLGIALTLQNIFFCFAGVLMGTLIGVLPGIGPLATISVLLPVTFSLDPISAIIMLAGIFYGAQYGGSTTAILVNMPGESSSVITALDGHQMARKGKAGTALAVAALGSFFAGMVGTLLIAVLAKPLSSIGLFFGAAEYFSLMALGLVAAAGIARGSVFKGVLMVMVGVALGLVGTDINSGAQRMTFGLPELVDGIPFVPLAMGLFGVAEILRNLDGGDESRAILKQQINSLIPSREDMKRSIMPVLRGTGIGTVVGILPGAGATFASFTSYMLERRLAKDPSRFGEGAVEGVAGPESANNAAAQGSFIPMLALGIPASPVMAVMIGAVIIHGIQPGPQMIVKQPELFWGLIASMWLGNILLLIINLPLVGIWVRFLRIPYKYLFPAILLFCAIGAYAVDFSLFDVWLTAGFAVAGLLLHKLGCEPAPLVLGFVLGPLMEENFRRALILSSGDPWVFLSSPLSAAFLALMALLIVVLTLPAISRQREKVFVE